MKQLILFSALFVFLGCSPTNTPKEGEIVPTNQIVLIFHKPVQNGYYLIPDGGGRSQERNPNGDEIQFLDDNMIEQLLHLNIGVESDTVIVKSKRDLVEIRLMYKGVDELKYLFQNGDSVVFNYSGIKPTAKVINRQEDYTVTNFSLVERDSLALDEYTALHITDLPLLLTYKGRNLDREQYNSFYDEIGETALRNISEELASQYELLEQLKIEGKITNKQLDYRIQNIYFQLAKLKASPLLKNKVEDEKASTLKNSMDNLVKRYPKIGIERSDSLVYNNAYIKYLLYTTSLDVREKVSSYNYNTGVSGGSIMNYPQAYDSIQMMVSLTPIEKKKLQFVYIEKLFQDAGYFPIEKRWEYLDKFNNDYQDSAMFDFLVEKFNIKFKIDDDLELVDKAGKATSLEALIASHKGKVLYIDYWASWCGPCINEMPSSKQLQKDLANENIVYVYLSSDRTDRPWQKAMERLELNEGLHFRIDNAGYTSKMEELNIPSIPRYMIYGTKGKLVNNNAPRPSQSKVLKAELMKYIETSQ
ncbi:TlpA family protein disulfide reductase [Roseivirga echinicomitans]|uniref:Thioredoxin domain-containing protein n=1 Tax=Roseivirga echinicomitans TaxID=296218 RepID=A0A150XJG5_9BACT|nr:TlpA disulfide reductase family protein [Roseivirga echinicomitans]KYG78812.1 hypothetical protein AWN68_04055 [Roseivirga echinicomitans]